MKYFNQLIFVASDSNYRQLVHSLVTQCNVSMYFSCIRVPGYFATDTN